MKSKYQDSMQCYLRVISSMSAREKGWRAFKPFQHEPSELMARNERSSSITFHASQVFQAVSINSFSPSRIVKRALTRRISKLNSTLVAVCVLYYNSVHSVIEYISIQRAFDRYLERRLL